MGTNQVASPSPRRSWTRSFVEPTSRAPLTRGCRVKNRSSVLGSRRGRHAGVSREELQGRSLAQSELDDAVGWYEREREGLGLEFIEEVDRVLARIETQEEFATSPLAVLDHGVVRREFVRRFPYVVV